MLGESYGDKVTKAILTAISLLRGLLEQDCDVRYEKGAIEALPQD